MTLQIEKHLPPLFLLCTGIIDNGGGEALDYDPTIKYQRIFVVEQEGMCKCFLLYIHYSRSVYQ